MAESPRKWFNQVEVVCLELPCNVATSIISKCNIYILVDECCNNKQKK